MPQTVPSPPRSTCTVSLRDTMKRLPAGICTPGNPMCAQLRLAGRRLQLRGPVPQRRQAAASSAAEVCSCRFPGRASQLCHCHGLSLHISDQRHVAGLRDNPRCGDARLQGCSTICSQGTMPHRPLQPASVLVAGNAMIRSTSAQVSCFCPGCCWGASTIANICWAPLAVLSASPCW